MKNNCPSDEYPGGGQNLEQLNVERLIFRTSEISNVKRTKDELFDFKNKSFLLDIFEHWKYLYSWSKKNMEF